jgi:hypothetical protein
MDGTSPNGRVWPAVARYARRMTDLHALARYRFEGKSEQAVREEWIRPLLVHLGYGIETLNEVQYETALPLAAPFRRIGRTRVKVDYVPTVLGTACG